MKALLGWGRGGVVLALGLWCLAPSMVRADSVGVSRECEAAIAKVQSRLESSPGVTKVKVGQSDMSSRHEDYPQGRPLSYSFVLSGTPEVRKTLYVSELLSALTNQVIQTCPSVSVVRFWMDRSDLGFTYGLVGDRVQAFKCIAPDRKRSTPIPWGSTICL